jgi:hypothetical protein
LPRIAWSPLFLAAEQSLVTRSGLISFFHDYLRQAVQTRYLMLSADQTATHTRLACYFSDSELDTRRLEELPWQLAAAGDWRQLYLLLGPVEFFDRLKQEFPYDLSLDIWIKAIQGFRNPGDGVQESQGRAA